MSSPIVNAASSVTPPVQEANIYVLGGTASSQTAAIPAAWRDQWITVFADGDDFYFAMGASGMVVDETAETTLPATFGGDECIKIPDGTSRDFDLRMVRKSVENFAWKGTGTAGRLRIERSSGAASL